MKVYTSEAVALTYTDCIDGQTTGGECSTIGDCPDCPMDDDC